jgi:hypothetical protein
MRSRHQPKKQRIQMRQATREQIHDQRILQLLIVALRARAVHDKTGMDGLLPILPRIEVAYIQPTSGRDNAAYAPLMSGQMATLSERIFDRQHPRRDTMAMRFPKGTQMAHEALPLQDAKRLPDLLRVRPQAVDHIPPADAPPFGVLHIAAQQSQHGSRSPRKLTLAIPRLFGRWILMRLRKQAPSREHVNGSTTPLLAQAHQ